MKIGIASHIVLDSIHDKKGKIHETLGGPPCYCGLTSRQFGFGVELATRVGIDFPLEKRDYLSQRGIRIKESHVASLPTTRFELRMEDDLRNLSLRSKCSPITEEDIEKTQVDCWLVSPVADEVPISVLERVKKEKGKKCFVMLDPQGYMRSIGDSGRITLADNLDLDVSGIDAIKVDNDELAALTGGLVGVEGMRALQSRGLDFILATEHRIVRLLHGKMHYWIKLREIDTPDSTGAGDILSAAFSCAYLKEKDPLWAFCFGAGALREALETKMPGLEKIPQKSKIETSASYYYNTVSFQQL